MTCARKMQKFYKCLSCESRDLLSPHGKIPVFTRMPILITVLIILTACASNAQTVENYLQHKGVRAPDQNTVQSCRGYGCKFVDTVTLSRAEWQKIARLFSPPSRNAKEERTRIAKAIGTFEQIIGPKTGTQNDRYGTFQKLGADQHDCVDESTNTTSYMLALQQRGHIKFHTINAPNVRLPIIHAGRWPHQSATITEIKSEESFAVDSWFHDNGAPAEITPLKQWKDGWKPDKPNDFPNAP